MIPFRSIRAKLLAIFVVAAVLPISALSLISYFNSLKAVKEMVGKVLTQNGLIQPIKDGRRIVGYRLASNELSDHEVTALFKAIDVLRRRGVAIVYTTHKMDEVFRLADRVTVTLAKSGTAGTDDDHVKLVIDKFVCVRRSHVAVSLRRKS